MKKTTWGAALLAFVFLFAACEGVTSSGGSGDDAGTSGGGADTSVAAPDGAGGGGEDAANEADAPCVPDCAGKECGDDGCGGTCGEGCADDATCTNFQCVVPDTCTVDDIAANCDGRECGGDGCGGTCGECDASSQCDLATGRCMCQSDCSGRECGLDPVCGVSCGMCQDGGTCNDGVCEADYPEGPYGTDVGDTIDNLVFYTPDGRPVELAQFYGQEKVIILTSAAGW